MKKSKEEIARCLEGDYRSEHLFALGQALELYEFYQAKVAQCDREIEAQLHKFQARIALELGIVRGAQFPNPAGLLEGSGRQHRYVAFADNFNYAI